LFRDDSGDLILNMESKISRRFVSEFEFSTLDGRLLGGRLNLSNIYFLFLLFSYCLTGY